MEKLTNCKACGKEIAKGVKKCPHCGKDQRNFVMKHKIFSALAVIVIIIVASSIGGNKEAKPSASNSNASNPNASSPSASNNIASPTTDTKISYDNFIKINMGAKYSEVVAIIGEGKELSSSEISGIKTIIYTWNGTGISNMNVTVQNDVVAGKAQLGLKSADDNITLEKYNQVKDGTAYSDAKVILGEGQIMSQTKIMNIESIMYEWINKDGSNAILTFSGDKLMMKAQFNLR